MKQKLLTYILMFAMLLGLPACGNTTESSIQPVEKVGTILISLNPEIEIEYDREGLVMAVLGLNDDGKFISAEQDDLIGLPCKIALELLIEDIFEAGYFSSDVGGPGRTIVLKLEKALFITKASCRHWRKPYIKQPQTVVWKPSPCPSMKTT